MSDNGKPNAASITIRCMRYEEIADAIRVFARQGLNDAIDTVQAFHEIDPGAFVVAYDESCGRVIGCCGAPKSTHATSFLGLYAVDTKYQGMGIGNQMFKKCLDYVGERNCGLSSVPAKFNIYKNRAGFQHEEGVSMVVYEGKANLDVLKTFNILEDKYQLEKITKTSWDDSLIKRIVEFDATVHLDNRDRLLRSTFKQKQTTTVAVVEKETDKLVGYGCVRPDIIDRACLGPLYATDLSLAKAITKELIQCEHKRALENGLMATTTDNSPRGMQLYHDLLELPETARCAKLYTKYIPPFNYTNLYLCYSPDFSC